MDRDVPASVVDERLAQIAFEQKVEAAINLFRQSNLSSSAAATDDSLSRHSDLFAQASQLDAKAKAILARRLLTHLETDQIQGILEFGLRELAERHRRSESAKPTSAKPKTRLLLKKDYSYQSRGLSQPTQYYVYLRRRKPKLDRYIGTLFYVPQGCTLSYYPDAEGRIFFNPPHNVFELKDSKKPSITQIVRLICLEPPPPDYTFSKQQDDNPEIYLRLEYLDAKSHQPIAEETYPFPFCMYEGGQLDRYRWDVSIHVLPADLNTTSELATQINEVNPSTPSKSDEAETSAAKPSSDLSESALAKQIPSISPNPSRRQVINLPTTASSCFYLVNRSDSTPILERIRMWVAWSKKAMPQSPWEIVQKGTTYTLRNASFKRNILSFSLDEASITLENSLPVVMKWFYDLSLAVSQSQNQRRFPSAQLRLAHSLFVNMSLSLDDPLVVLEKLFDLQFSSTSLYS